MPFTAEGEMDLQKNAGSPELSPSSQFCFKSISYAQRCPHTYTTIITLRAVKPRAEHSLGTGSKVNDFVHLVA